MPDWEGQQYPGQPDPSPADGGGSKWYTGSWDAFINGLRDIFGLAGQYADAANKLSGRSGISGNIDFSKFALYGLVAVTLIISLFLLKKGKK